MNVWALGDKHKLFGKVVMMRTIEGEPYRFFSDGARSFSMIPLSILKAKDEIKEGTKGE